MFLKEKLTECREEKNHSFDGLMIGLSNIRMKVTSQTLRNWEAGSSTPTVKQLGKISQFYKKPVSYFFDKNVEVFT